MVRPSRFQGPIPGRQRQLGVAAVYAAFSLIAGTSAMALAIDTGQLYYAQRDLEKLAGAAALDATRAAAGCFTGGSGAPPTSVDTLTKAVSASIQRNLDTSRADTLTQAKDFMQPVAGVNTVEIGSLSNSTANGARTGVRTFASTESIGGLDNNGTDAIRVNLARIQPTPLIPFIFSTAANGTGAGLLRASASAQQTPAAAYSIGSALANINSASSPILNMLFATLFGPNASAAPLNITAASYQSLAGASVTLGAIAAQLGLVPSSANGTPVGTLPPAVANAQVSVQNVLTAEAAVLNQQGQSAAASAISAIAAITDPGQSTNLGALSGVVDPIRDTVVGALPISAFDLLTSLGGSVKNGLYPIKLMPSVNLPLNLANTDIFVTVGDAGSVGSGHAGLDSKSQPRSPANTAQVTLMLRQKVTVPGLATLRLGTDVAVASATSFLSSIGCPSGVNNKPTTVTVDVTTAPATVAVGTFTDAAESAPVTAGPLLSVTVPLVGAVTVSTNGIIPAQQIASTSHSTPVFTGPFPSPTQTVGGNVNALDVGTAVLNSVNSLSLMACLKTNPPLVTNTCSNVSVGGVLPPSGSLLNTLVVAPLLATLSVATGGLDTVVDSLLSGLGASAGTATVSVTSVIFRNTAVTVASDAGNSAPRLFNLDTTVGTANNSGTR